jgi:glycosyltransferase involved in cell wall biosynthesis
MTAARSSTMTTTDLEAEAGHGFLFPLVSVIIPTFNRPQLLIERALSSALGQNYPNLEVLVVMDGPDPKTQAALDDISDPRLRPMALPENMGASQARNAGIQAARGEWIAFLDDDDEWRPNKLARQMAQALRSRYRFPVVFSSWITRTPQGDTLNPPRLKQETERLGDYLLIRHSPRLTECSLTCSMIFAPRELLLRSPFVVFTRKHEDWDWMLRTEQLPGVGFEQVPPDDASALTIYYFAENRDFASKFTAWEPSLVWAQLHRKAGRLSERAFAGFIISQLAPFPAAAYDMKGFQALTRALLSTRPGLYELLRYFKLWAIPAPVRRNLKASGLRLLRLARESLQGRPQPVAPPTGAGGPGNSLLRSGAVPVRSVTLIDPFATGHHTPYAVMLCQEFNKRGVQVNVVGPEALVSACAKEAVIHRSAVVDLRQGSSRDDYHKKGRLHEEQASYQFTRQALKLAQSWNSDIAHFVFLDSFILSLLAAMKLSRIGNMRVYTTLHWAYMLPDFRGSGRLAHLRSGAQLLALRALMSLNVRMQVHSRSFVAAIGKYTLPKNISYIPYPVEEPFPTDSVRVEDVRRSLGVSSDVKLLLAFGGTRRNKGADRAIRALSHLPSEYHLIVLGAEQDFTAEFMTDLAQQLGVQDRLHLRLEYLSREDYEPYFVASAAAVLPYTPHFSGQSGVMFIAGAIGTPVVASDAGTIAETVNQFELGEIFSNTGTPDEVAADMARAVRRATEQESSPEVRRQRQARFTQAHSLDSFVDAVLADYQLSPPAHMKSSSTAPQPSALPSSYAVQEPAMSESFAQNKPRTP